MLLQNLMIIQSIKTGCATLKTENLTYALLESVIEAMEFKPAL